MIYRVDKSHTHCASKQSAREKVQKNLEHPIEVENKCILTSTWFWISKFEHTRERERDEIERAMNGFSPHQSISRSHQTCNTYRFRYIDCSTQLHHICMFGNIDITRARCLVCLTTPRLNMRERLVPHKLVRCLLRPCEENLSNGDDISLVTTSALLRLRHFYY
jgi:hypothetical protein